MTKERQAERVSERKSSSNKGPQYIPEDLLDENYHYRFVYYSNDTMWKALEQEKLGYEPVKQAELAQIKSKVVLPNTTLHDGLVSIPEKGGAISVLMRIPRAVYEERLAEEKAERDAELRKTLGTDYAPEGHIKPRFTFTNNNSN